MINAGQQSNKIQSLLAPYRGMLRMWLYDIGCLSFIATGLMAFGLGLLMLFQGKHDAAWLVFSMGIVSISTAITWQVNRLAATEWSNLVPHYRAYVIQQALSLFVVTIAFVVVVLASFSVNEVLSNLLVPINASLIFMSLTLKNSHRFHLSFLLFFSVPFMDSLAIIMPVWLNVLVLVVALYQVARQLTLSKWDDEARIVYLNAVQMGWMWLPSIKSHPLLNRLDRLLHPMNFFIGPILTLVLLALPILGLGLILVSISVIVNFPALFLISQLILIICSVIHWSRIQRWQAAETLFLLPSYNGLAGLRDAFFYSQMKLIWLLVAIMLALCGVSYLVDDNYTLGFIVHLGLSTFWSCAILLGLGSACKNIKQSIIVLLVIILHAFVTPLSFKALSHNESMFYWLVTDVALVIVGLIALYWGKTRLWRNGVTEP